MNKKSIQKLHSSFKNIAKIQPNNKKFSFKYESNFLNYQSHLRDFSSEHYKIFDQLFSELDIRSGGETIVKIVSHLAGTAGGRLDLKHSRNTTPGSHA